MSLTPCNHSLLPRRINSDKIILPSSLNATAREHATIESTTKYSPEYIDHLVTMLRT